MLRGRTADVYLALGFLMQKFKAYVSRKYEGRDKWIRLVCPLGRHDVSISTDK
jgi:hypothetical protein